MKGHTGLWKNDDVIIKKKKNPRKKLYTVVPISLCKEKDMIFKA